ncbi:MAG: adenylate/guanylate cyclase domain-containing protein [Chloroflexi bacterium]|nr:adenylate/guanylate cyclase domain-containing protein [Chloroflexota bacterium]
MKIFSDDGALGAPLISAAPRRLLWRFTLIYGPLLGFGLGLGLAAVSGDAAFVLKEILLGALAGALAPFFVPLALRLVPQTQGADHDLRRYVMYFTAGAFAGAGVWLANQLFPLHRPWTDPLNLWYIIGVAGLMPFIGFAADALHAQRLAKERERAEKERTRVIFGQYVSESIAQRILDASGGALLQSETRTATVLISDIRGFTRMIQDLGAEQVVRTLNDYFTRMIDVIAQYDGTVNKFIGDAIVVLYNAPVSQPDANARALQTARAMQAAVAAMNTQRAAQSLAPLHIGIAIDAGEVVCGNVGSPKRLEYTAIGAPVNTAYHLASLAPADSIYLTENVYQALNGSAAATLALQMELKGGTGKLNVYKLDV